MGLAAEPTSADSCASGILQRRILPACASLARAATTPFCLPFPPPTQKRCYLPSSSSRHTVAVDPHPRHISPHFGDTARCFPLGFGAVGKLCWLRAHFSQNTLLAIFSLPNTAFQISPCFSVRTRRDGKGRNYQREFHLADATQTRTRDRGPLRPSLGLIRTSSQSLGLPTAPDRSRGSLLRTPGTPSRRTSQLRTPARRRLLRWTPGQEHSTMQGDAGLC